MSIRSYLLAGVGAVMAVAAIAWLGGPWSEPSAPGAAPPAASASGGQVSSTIAVEPAKAERMGIRVAPAAVADTVPVVTIPGTIEPPANARVAVAATFPGVVITTHGVEGQKVARGQTLAVISSRDILSMGAELKAARARLHVAQARAARLGQLSREGIIAGARADEAAAEATQAAAEVASRARILSDIGADPASGRYRLRAPIAGTIATADITAGRPLDGQTAPFVIDAADRYQAVGQLPERLVDQVAPGLVVRTTGGVRGRVVSVGRVVSPETRSVVLKAELPAGAGLVAGATTDLLVLRAAPAGAAAVPESAVSRVGGRPAVFVPAPGGYAIRFVDLGGTADAQSIVVSGIRPGDPVVVAGASALKSLARAD